MPNEAAETQVTQLLHAAGGGDPRASEQLLPLVYAELHRLAQAYMQREKPGQTLQATALVHDAYVRLVGGAGVSWDSRGHFFGAAARAMRRILVEKARMRAQLKRGAGRDRVDLAEVAVFAEPGTDGGTDLVALDGALEKLGAVDRRKHEVVMLKYFAGLTNDEAAAALGVSSATVRNDWTYSKAWLIRELRGGAPGVHDPHDPRLGTP
jgi:RNA polymerase sigma factor (TIGR02999 family)